MLSRLVRGQLIAFLAVTIVTLAYVSANYLRLPQILGFGTYTVSMHLADSSSLYPRANVTYRGQKVGTVGELTHRPGGVSVELNINKGVQIPSGAIANVHSTSAIGEQYINFVPSGDAGPKLEDGDVIPVSQTKVPVTTPELLEGVHSLVKSVPQDSLRITVDEMYKAFNGTGDDMQTLLDEGNTLMANAERNFDPTVDLINKLVPVLGTQEKVSPDIRKWSGHLNSFTSQLVKSDRELRGVINKGSPFAREVTGTMDDLDTSLPILMADMASAGQVLRVYIPGIEHLLIVYPAVITGIQTAAAGPPEQFTSWDKDPLNLPEARVNFKAGVNSPPICTKGFEYAQNQRDPNDLSPAPLSDDSYCKVPPNDPRDVRGSRNLPCPNNPSMRGPKAESCGLIFPRFDTGLGKEQEVMAASTSSPKAVEYNPDTGRVMAPDGQFYLLEDAAGKGLNPKTWQDLLKAPLGLSGGK